MFVTKKDWEEYTEQVSLYNQIKIEDTNRANEELQKEFKQVGGFFIPCLRTRSLEDCMDWILGGKKNMVKELEVKQKKS